MSYHALTIISYNRPGFFKIAGKPASILRNVVAAMPANGGVVVVAVVESHSAS